jgi:hypothetical protein
VADQSGPDRLGSLRPDNDPNSVPRGPWYRGFRRPTQHAEGSRSWAGRPLTLALGWFLSCIVITAVTLTAVQRVGREVSGSQGLLTTQGAIRQQVAAQSASAASASSASLKPIAPVVVADGAPASTAPAVAPTAAHPTPTKHSSAPVASAPVVASSSAASITPTPVIVKPPPGATEYVYVCLAGKAVGGPVVSSPSPSASPSPSVTATGTGTATPSPTTTPTVSGSASPTNTTTSSASPTPTPGKTVINVRLGTSPIIIGQIVIACSGDSIANANATTVVPGYTLTVRSTSNPQLDVFFAKT